jgi:hypothetical protein
MDTKVDTVLATLNATLQTTIQTQLSSMESKLDGTITNLFAEQSGSIVSKVVASMTGTEAPFVTAAGLKTVMDTCMDSINKRLDKLTPLSDSDLSDHEKSPLRKHLKTGVAIPMDIQPRLPLTDSSATDGKVGQKN